MQDVVEPPVPGPGQPVPAVFAGGGVDRGGAGPGREVRLGGEAGHVTDVGEDPRRPAEQHHEPVTMAAAKQSGVLRQG